MRPSRKAGLVALAVSLPISLPLIYMNADFEFKIGEMLEVCGLLGIKFFSDAPSGCSVNLSDILIFLLFMIVLLFLPVFSFAFVVCYSSYHRLYKEGRRTRDGSVSGRG